MSSWSPASREKVQEVLRPQDIDLAGAQSGDPLLVAQRHEGDLVGLAEHGGGQGAAEIDVEAAPVSAIVTESEARQLGIHPATQLAARLDGLQGLAGRGGFDGQRRRLFGGTRLGRGFALAAPREREHRQDHYAKTHRHPITP